MTITKARATDVKTTKELATLLNAIGIEVLADDATVERKCRKCKETFRLYRKNKHVTFWCVTCRAERKLVKTNRRVRAFRAKKRMEKAVAAAKLAVKLAAKKPKAKPATPKEKR